MDPNALDFVPCLPETAPFSPEQRAYLNGFFAGLFARAPLTQPAYSPPRLAAPLVPVSILFGSQTGNAENLARRTAKIAGQRGFAPTVHDLSKYAPEQLASEARLLVISSTYGDGEPPDNAKAFWKFLSEPGAPKLPQLQFSVCALGDSNYPKFCVFGKGLDQRLAELGGQCVHPCASCDVDFDEPFSKWLEQTLEKLGAQSGGSGPSAAESAPRAQVATPLAEPTGYSRSNPFAAPLLTNNRLNAPGSEKEIRHFEFDLSGSGLQYEAGDALGVFPGNCQELVEDLLDALNSQGNEPVTGRGGVQVSFREALLCHYEITRIPRMLLEAMAQRTGDATLRRLAAPDANGELTAFLRGREIIDLLLAHPAVKFAPTDFVALLKPLAPRLYSIASSPKAHPARAHLTVNVVRYETLARKRKGVCSTYLANRVSSPRRVPLFLQPNRNFRPPADPGAAMIMVGPGTGVAPFRAFLQERRAMGAKGRNWLFFGDQRSATDFLYRDEFESLRQEGVLTRLDTAFSRDQAEKVYVQHRMREHAAELFAWLEAGAYFYVCGDAGRMARDVDAVLHEIVQTAGGRTADQAADYVSGLQEHKRYLRDVY